TLHHCAASADHCHCRRSQCLVHQRPPEHCCRRSRRPACRLPSHGQRVPRQHRHQHQEGSHGGVVQWREQYGSVQCEPAGCTTVRDRGDKWWLGGLRRRAARLPQWVLDWRCGCQWRNGAAGCRGRASGVERTGCRNKGV
ncbi:hypothetical protein LTS18_009040, partial [Coniosporium uncinatum]